MLYLKISMRLLVCSVALAGCVPEDPAVKLKNECVKLDNEIKGTTSQMKSSALICEANSASCDPAAKANLETRRKALIKEFKAKNCASA